MVLRLAIKKTLSARSDRVKCVDFHPTEPWMLVSLYNGQCHIWNFESQTLAKTFEVSDLPARAGKFIARKNWFAVGCDDLHVRVFNYNTHEKVHAFEAHTDYIRCLTVHPTQPFVLTSADDMLIKLWDWDKNWKNIMTFEGHTHYVMSVVFNPKDVNTFASASLDKTIKIWNLGSSVPNYTLDGHEKGVNWVDYYHGTDKPYLVSAGDDKMVKVWDYQNKSCVQTLTGHTQNVCVACFHPELPVIISGGEDGSVRIWHANTFRLENTLGYGMERVWTIAYQRGSNSIGLGFDEGSLVIKLGREDPSVSMDTSGKIIWARHNDIQTATIQGGSESGATSDGDRVQLAVKDLGNCEVFPQSLQHSPNGRFAVVCGDGEYIIYTALSWRNKSFGTALEFVWAQDSNEYAVREGPGRVNTFKAFKERHSIRNLNGVESIFGGALLACCSGSTIFFYDWATGTMIRRIDAKPTNIFWSDNGDLVCIACADQFFIIKYDKLAVQDFLAEGRTVPEGGIDAAFSVLHDIQESVKQGCWVGDCFIYCSTASRLNYLIGGQVHTISHFDRPMYLLGYLPRDSKIYVCDKDVNVFGYSLSLQLLEFQSAILRQDIEAAQAILPSLSTDQRNRVARFLESLNMKEWALQTATDPDHRFDLALKLKKLDVARQLAAEADVESKWQMLGELAMSEWKLPLARECMQRSKDWPGLLLMHLATGNAQGLEELAAEAHEQGLENVTFMCHLLSNHPEKCMEMLLESDSDRISEAALFARTYLPSHTSRIVSLWRASLLKGGFKKSAEAIADPCEYENLFPGLKRALVAEIKSVPQRGAHIDAKHFAQWKEQLQQQQEQKPAADADMGIPSISDLVLEAQAAYQKQPSGAAVSKLSAPAPAPQRAQSPAVVIAPGSPQTPAGNRGSAPVSGSGPPSPVRTLNSSLSVNRGQSDGVNDENADSISENMSHMSMEVNTTGTGSVKGDQGDLADTVSERSFASSEAVFGRQPVSLSSGAALSTPPASVPLHVGHSGQPAPGASATAVPTNSARPNAMDQFDLDELDAALAGATPGQAAAAQHDPMSLTGDPELDDILNM